METSREETFTMLPKTSPSSAPESIKPGKSGSRAWKTNVSLVLSILTLAIASLVLSVVHYSRQQHGGLVTPHAIGGRLSTLQAKTIDFLCAALFAPLLMLVLDYIWFSNARMSVLNEKQSSRCSGGVPLPSLVEASITSAGSFDLVKLRTLIRGKTWRLYVLGLLVLLSGTASKALANFIAYEAYDVQTPRSQFARLRLLSDPYFHSPGFLQRDSFMISDLPFTMPQKADFANQLSALLTGLRFESAVSKLDASGAYIGSNATDASLNSLDRSIVGLTNVPGYRLTTDCQVSQPQFLNSGQMGISFRISAMFPDLPVHSAVLPGADTITNPSGYSETNKYIAFSVNGSAYLGHLDNRLSNITMPSEFGPLPSKEFNLTRVQGFNYTNWGVICNINRQEGFINYTRQLTGAWQVSETFFSKNKTVISAPLKQWQTVLDYHAPQVTISGIGPAIGETAGPDYVTDTNMDSHMVNWTTYAMNYLYASGRAQQIAFEVVASNSTNDTSSTYHYAVDATTLDQRYRITYIPLILIVGLISTMVAAALAGGLFFYTRNTTSVQTARQVDGLRFVVDSVSGLHDSAEEMAVAGDMKQGELEKWAAKFQVRYLEVREGGGTGVVVRLARAGL
ncbi:hypothetical protein BDW68DRAFT_150494 [Aspergillus falconensis]